MQDATSEPYVRPSARQVDYWNSTATAPWVTLQERLDRLMAPLAAAALSTARPAPGERVLDIGCGCGATVLDLAREVGVTGHVTGVDISKPMLARAAERVAAEQLHHVALTLADAETACFDLESIDLVFSRLGIMFFDDPVRAFANIRRALRPTGRMVFLCCRTPAENPYISTAVQVARPMLPLGAVPIPPPNLPGMFSFADAARVRDILAQAGFKDVAVTAHDERMQLAGPGGAGAAAAFSVQFGPLTRVLDDAEPALKDSILRQLAETYRHIEEPEGIILNGGFWIVAARP